MNKLITTTAALAITASGAFAADIALVIGSNQDSFWNVVKKGAEDAAIECSKHSSIFDVSTGEVETPPACENLHTYKTKVEADRVFVGI
jgi:nitrite reductase/ring-hydroxylating ferredoxin subunit